MLPKKILETLVGILLAAGASCEPDFAGFALLAQLPFSQKAAGEPQEAGARASAKEGACRTFARTS